MLRSFASGEEPFYSQRRGGCLYLPSNSWISRHFIDRLFACTIHKDSHQHSVHTIYMDQCVSRLWLYQTLRINKCWLSKVDNVLWERLLWDGRKHCLHNMISLGPGRRLITRMVRKHCTDHFGLKDFKLWPVFCF